MVCKNTKYGVSDWIKESQEEADFWRWFIP